MNSIPPAPRNPGPSWGFGFLLWAERWWPRWFFRPMLMIGTWGGFAFMPAQRTHSRAYLSVVFGRPARMIEMWRHFFAFAEFLMLKLRVGRGQPIISTLDSANENEFEKLVTSDQPALFGTFHFGSSDLLGYLLGERGRRVSIIRLRVGNSDDTRLLGQRFGENVSFLWINDPANLLFDLKSSIESGASLALKCDRLEFSAKTESFHFLGAKRLFPFTIYYLAILFVRPVVFCTAVPVNGTEDKITVFSSTVFTPNETKGRDFNLQAAKVHFQAVLIDLERLIRLHPYLWFNFLPLNSVVSAN